MILLFGYRFRHESSCNCTCDSHHIWLIERLLNPSPAFSLRLSSPIFNLLHSPALKWMHKQSRTFDCSFFLLHNVRSICCFWLQEYTGKASGSLQLKKYIVNASCWRVQYCPLSCLPLCVCVCVFSYPIFYGIVLLFWLCIYIWSVAANYTT